MVNPFDVVFLLLVHNTRTPCSFNSYSIRRATSPVKLKKKAAGPGKASAKATEAFRHSEPMYHDDTDTVALLSPHIIEVDLWPPVGGYAPARASSESSGTLVNGVSPRLAFLKEAKSVAELRHLENAMCDIRYVYSQTSRLLLGLLRNIGHSYSCFINMFSSFTLYIYM